MDIKKSFSKFLLLGISALALGGFAFSNSETIKNTVDQQLFSHLNVTAFQNVEDIKLAHSNSNVKNHNNSLAAVSNDVHVSLKEYEPSSENINKDNKEQNQVSQASTNKLQNYEDIKDSQNETNNVNVNKSDFLANLKTLKAIYLDTPSAGNKNNAKI